VKILLCHNYYQNRGGEDIVFDTEKELLIENSYKILEYSKNSSDVNNMFNKAVTFLGSLFSLKTYIEVGRIIKKEKPDIAHVHNIFPVISPSIYYVLKNNNIKIIQTIHNYRFYCSNGLSLKDNRICSKCENVSIKNIFNICSKNKKLYDLLLSVIIYFMRKLKVYSKVDYFIAPSKFIKNKLIKFGIGKEKIILKRNLIKINKKFTDREKQSSKYFTFIGRLSEEKGIIRLIEIFKKEKEIELKIIGNGPLKEYINNIIKNEKIGNIEISGFIEGKKKYSIISNSMANIIPSICYENCPVVLIECLSMGVPVVVNNIGALPEFIKDGYNGYIYNSNDLNSLKKIVLKIYNMKDIELNILKENCENSYSDLFDEDKNFKIINNLYKRILKVKND